MVSYRFVRDQQLRKMAQAGQLLFDLVLESERIRVGNTDAVSAPAIWTPLTEIDSNGFAYLCKLLVASPTHRSLGLPS